MDNTLVKKLELLAVQTTEKELRDDTMDTKRAGEIADIVLKTLHDDMKTEELLKAKIIFDSYPELTLLSELITDS